MKVSLIKYDREALELLLFTKQTRLSMDAGLMDEIRAWPMEKKMAELSYMLATIESSWEFISYVFSIEAVSRAFTHQLVRTRSAHFAQQSQRTVDMSDFSYVTPEAFARGSELDQCFCWIMESQNEDYRILLGKGASPQDARSVLPTNVATNIIIGADLRTLSHMAEVRLCSRTQGEYQNVFRLMRNAVIEVHPWAEPFIRVACAKRGVCQFPNYKECPIKPGIFNPDTGGVWPGTYIDPITNLEDCVQRDGTFYTDGEIEAYAPLTKAEIQDRWELMKFEAVPKQMK